MGWCPGRETRHAAFSTTVLAMLFFPTAQLSSFDYLGSKAMYMSCVSKCTCLCKQCNIARGRKSGKAAFINQGQVLLYPKKYSPSPKKLAALHRYKRLVQHCPGSTWEGSQFNSQRPWPTRPCMQRDVQYTGRSCKNACPASPHTCCALCTAAQTSIPSVRTPLMLPQARRRCRRRC